MSNQAASLHIIFKHEVTDVKDPCNPCNKFREVTFYDVYHVNHSLPGLVVQFTPDGEHYFYPWHMIGRVKTKLPSPAAQPAANVD